MAQEKKKKTLSQKLRQKYRLVIMSDASFAEKFSLRLTPGGFLISIGAVTIFMTFLVISLVAFTPLKEYIPGYGDISDRKALISLSLKADSIEQLMYAKTQYIENLQNVLNGNINTDTTQPKKNTEKNNQPINTKPSKNDSDLRREIEQEDKFSLSISSSPNINGISGYFFFSPVKGMVTHSFNMAEKHYGVDVATKENDFVKATLDGTVIYAGWTTNDGYVVQLQHKNNLMSLYKHNSEVIKSIGDHVKAGEPIAVVGNTGETSNGTHLHFELWYNGLPINPQDYVLF
ncbi:MAG: M23 family metallopeptidase [Bacteroidetes bacterium]|nr:M23 family metallopeptidase [Bacteroidota bacterium]